MYQSIKKTTVIFSLVFLCIACESKPSLQTFYVDNEEKQGFVSLDVPTSFLDIEDELTEKQKDAYDSVDKLNMLSFVIEDGGTDNYEKYLGQLKSIFKNPKYEELMRGNIEDGGKFKLMFTGEADALDELILFGSSSERGFAVIRILGDDMNADDLVELGMSFQNINPDNSNVNEILNFFK